MNHTKLNHSVRWDRVCSQPGDLARIPRLQSLRILFDMMLIREFEHAVLRLKEADCVWGPVHSSVGQEAAAAASIRALRASDRMSGSHRAHHQFLSKVLGAVLDDEWDPAADELPAAGVEAVRRTLGEIMGLRIGYCGGRGGSMHLRSAEAGVLGTNAIVAGGVPLATGAAYAQQYRRTGDIVVSYFGDGAVNQGAFHEACNLAGVWNLPIIFCIENNLYAVGTRAEEATAVDVLSQRALAYNMNAVTVDGNDVVALYETMRLAAEELRAGGRPWMVEVLCYRLYHHGGGAAGSAYGYRSREEEEAQRERDALSRYPADLREAGLVSETEIDAMQEKAAACVQRAVEACTDVAGGDTAAPAVKPDLWPSPEELEVGLRSAGGELADITYSRRSDFSDFHPITYSAAIAGVTGRWMERDDSVVVIGEEVASFGGGAYGATKGLPKRFPDRVRNTPISEAGFAGLALGASMCGMRPVVEIMFPDFALVAADQLFNQIAKARHMYGGTTDVSLVARTRIATGCGYGGQHSMDPVALFALFPGWRIVAPGTAFDYVGLFNTAMQSNDPVIFLEHHTLYGQEFDVPADTLDYYLPFGRAEVLEEGTDVTVVGYGAMPGRLRRLATVFAEQDVSVEIVDLRTVDLPSLDLACIGHSLKKTGAVVTVEEAAASQAIGPRITSALSLHYFDELDGPCYNLTSADVPNPVSRALEAAAMLDDEQIVRTVVQAARRQL